MEIKLIQENKREFLDLLLSADEQESMINRYLDKGEMFALYDGDLKCVCVVTREEEGIYEIKNIAAYERYRGQGYGRKLVEYIFEYYRGRCRTMYVGTGDSMLTIPFYEKCGFRESHRIPGFFTEHYDHPIIECGKQLTDMVYLRKDF